MIYAVSYGFRFTIHSALYEINHKSEIINKRLADNYLLTIHNIDALLHLLYAATHEVID